MADKKKKNKSRVDEDSEKPTKEECTIAKYLRFSMEPKEARLVGMAVKYFVASEAIDKLMESKWATSSTKQDNIFSSRQSCVMYMDRLLHKGMFHRALRIEKKKKDDKGRKKESEVEESQDDKKLRRRRKGKKDDTAVDEKDKNVKDEKDDTEKEEKRETEEKTDEKKKKRKLKLKMHEEQIFMDGDQVYVWIYDPVNGKTFVIGLLMVLGSIGLCLFPLWPPVVRQGVYYCSLAGALFVGFILLLALVRFILFCVIWLATGGKHHFWFLPNLTEDVGFFDSFKPLYTYSFKGPDPKGKKSKKPTVKTEKDDSGPGDKSRSERQSENDNANSGTSDDDEYEIVDRNEVTEED